MELSSLSSTALLALHGSLIEELRARGLVRSSNNPAGDLAECLFCRAFGWQQAGNSNANLDAIDAAGIRYQIKGRRITSRNSSRQLSAIRELSGAQFDILAGVLFSESYTVLRAALIPRDVVVSRSKYVERTNSHKFILHNDVWNLPGVIDVTDPLRAVQI